MRLLYFYMQFLDDKGKPKHYRGMKFIELNLSSTDLYTYDTEVNTFHRGKRKVPLPTGFWTYRNTKTESCNIYNINVIAGQNGSGKSTIIRCLINLLDYYHNAAFLNIEMSRQNDLYGIEHHRSLLLLEQNRSQYLLSYVPVVWTGDERVQFDGFNECMPYIMLSHGKPDFNVPYGNDIRSLLLQSKVIYMTNTLNHDDYERHVRKQNECHKDAFIYDVSIGAAIGTNVGHFFANEVYKQVRYVFDKEQAVKRKDIPEFTMPRALRLRLHLEQYQKDFLCSTFPIISTINKAEGEYILPEELDLATLLGMLCVAAYGDNLGIRLNDGSLPVRRNTKYNRLTKIPSPMEELNSLILEQEKWFQFMLRNANAQSHAQAVTCVATLPDGRIISGSMDNTLRVWDAERKQLLRTLSGHTGGINCITILSDGRVVSGSNDKTLKIWDPNTGQCNNTLVGHKGGITCVTVLPNGQIVSGSHDHTLMVWDPDSNQCLHRLGELTYSNSYDYDNIMKLSITCIAVLPNGLVVSAYGKSLEVWDVTKGEKIYTLEGHTGKVTCMAVLQEGLVISGSSYNTLRIWDVYTGECLQMLGEHADGKGITCVGVLQDGRIVSGSDDCSLRIWDSVTGRCLSICRGHMGAISCIGVLSNGNIISGSSDSTLRVWDTNTGKCLHKTEKGMAEVFCMAVLPDDRIAIGFSDWALRIWDPSKGSNLKALRVYSVDLIKNKHLNDQVIRISHNNDGEGMSKEQIIQFEQSLTQSCQRYLKFLDENGDHLFRRFKRINDNTYELALDTIEDTDKDDIYQMLVEFIQNYQNICKPVYTIDFDWGLSSGEENMLRIFSNLYHVFDRDSVYGGCVKDKIYNDEIPLQGGKMRKECDTVLFFMDEADLTLHPEWQRRLIAVLTFFIPQIYPCSCIKDIQMILTTHSPLILGDIPGDNITYLPATKKQGDNSHIVRSQGEEMSILPSQEETFGQNIHTILKESFFLENGTVGAFAAGKINTAAKRLIQIKAWASDKNKSAPLRVGEMEEIRQIVDIVAPGVIRNRLEELYKETSDELTKSVRNKVSESGEKVLSIMRAEEWVCEFRKLSREQQRYIQKVLGQETSEK